VPLANNQIHQGDCVDLLGQLDEGTVDLVFADPPFNIGYEYDVYDDAQEGADYLHWCGRWIRGVYRALKPNGTFWLAIGDEYAAELKIEAQEAGFHCRSWVIWYYTFGVNCVNGFSRSHTHLFHFVKDPKQFTFNRPNPQIRVRSARELVYADARANPNGRLPDNTWIIRPQDAPLSFSPIHDTWYFARVAGTFKERMGFHGCQMPEQLLARIIRTSSRPQDLVLDPFGGSGTTLCVAKKLGRQWLGFELSLDYVRYIDERLAQASVGDPLDGPEDPIQSAPSTSAGKRRRKSFDQEFEVAAIEAYSAAGQGYPTDFILCDKDLNEDFVSRCISHGLGGNAELWNRFLLRLQKAKKLPKPTRKPDRISPERLNRYGFASEVAWRLLAIDYRKTLDEIFCSPEFAAEFDRLAVQYGPVSLPIAPREYRLAAFAIRKQMKSAREQGVLDQEDWITKRIDLVPLTDRRNFKLATSGVFVLRANESGIFAYESSNIRDLLESLLENPNWTNLGPDSVAYVEHDPSIGSVFALKSALIRREKPVLNACLWVVESELPLSLRATELA
jgi:site-specific DNA-methyltransferase (adenine-specific)